MSRTVLFLAVLCFIACNALAPLKLVKKSDRIPGEYIVVMYDNSTSVHLKSLMSVLQKSHGLSSFTHVYEHVFKGFAAKLTKPQVLAIRQNPQVEYIEEDGKVHLVDEQQFGDCRPDPNDADWGLARICKRQLNLDGEYYFPPSAGARVDSYIIDTGIYPQHSDFGGRARMGWKARADWPDTDDHGHGTHVASTVGGTKYGVCKGIHLIGVKVLDRGGSGSWADVISGINYCVSEKQKSGKPSTANMSLGGGKQDSVNRAVNAASAAGVMMVAAAGNNNGDACNTSPASSSDCITVGATDLGSDPNDGQIDVRSYFSNYGKCTHVFAPGSNILGAWIGNPTATRVLSGTSMASPHTCGVASLVLDANPGMTFQQVRDEVQDMATFGVINLQCTNQICEASPNLMLFNGCE